MYNFLLRRGTTIAFVIGFLASLAIIAVLISAVGDTASDNFEALNKLPAFGFAAIIAIIFLFLAVAAIILGGIFGVVTNPKASVKFLIGIVALLVVFGILYAAGNINDTSYAALRNAIEEYDISTAISKMINAGLIASLVLLAVAFGAVLLAEVRNAFK